MHPSHASLFVRIRDFSIDDGCPDFSFAARLARENGWTMSFATRVIVEYKRFVFLAMTAGHPVTPSAQVDEAWHLHLTFTRSYWVRLCGDVLNRPLHHEPTRGGRDEAAKFHDQYRRTLESYRQAFGQAPPSDIWPAVQLRFGDDLHAVRVNPRRNWIVPKHWVTRGLLATLAVAILTVVCGCGIVPGISITPQDALRCFPFAWLAALMVTWRIREALRSGSNQSERELTWEEQARLLVEPYAVKGSRLFDATLTRLVAIGAAELSPSSDAIVSTGRVASPLSAPELLAWKALPFTSDGTERIAEFAKTVEGAFEDAAERLELEGFLMSNLQRVGIGLVCVAAMALSFAVFYVPVVMMVEDADFVVGLLCVSIPAIAVPGLVLGFATMSRLTRLGKRVRSGLSRDAWDCRHTSDDPSAGVAAFGRRSLTHSRFASLAKWFPTPAVSASGGSGCGGRGCGGGCGGCGGCGG